MTAGAGSRRRIGVAVIDQAVSGASNVLAILVGARLLQAEEFAHFAFALLVYGLALSVTRAALANPILMRPVESERDLPQILGASVVLSLACGVLVAGAGAVVLLWSTGLGTALVLLGLFLPLLVLQDTGRFLGLAFQTPKRALTLDTTWLLLFIAAAGALAWTDRATLALVTIAWAGSGAVAGLGTLLFWGRRGLRSGRAWFAANWHLQWRFALISAATQASVVGIAVVVLAMVGPEAVAAITGAQLLVRLYTMADPAVVGAGTAEVARVRDDRHHAWHQIRQVTLIGVVVALVNAVPALLLPDFLGEQLLGDTWAETEPLVLPFAAMILFRGMVAGARAGVVGMGQVRKSTRIALWSIPPMLAITVLGCWWGGALGGAWAVAASRAVVVPAWFLTARRSLDLGPVDETPVKVAPKHRAGPTKAGRRAQRG